MNKIATKVGTIVVISDYIKAKKNKITGELTYVQSNTPLDGYTQRFVGIYINNHKDIYVGVAVNSKKDTSNSNWWEYIIKNRIVTSISKGSFTLEDKGITMVPFAYKDLLYKDPCAYNNLFGMIDPTMLDMCINQLIKFQEKRIVDKKAQLDEQAKALNDS